MIVTGNEEEEISSLQKHLATEFEMKNLGGLKYFLGTPIVQNHGLGEHLNQTPTNRERYQRLVGKLIYLSHIRLDIAYATSLMSQFMHNPNDDHMNALLQILRHLKFSLGKGLMFRKYNHLNIDGYMDADWAGSIIDRKSTSGYFTFVGGNLVT
ncbi:uncharacterized mitochondrial protein AtMg00810-like [Cornus florida]|uniref:uncharacterized mitochondrial protein AtMg00810-like n=1 Tax=Cornus florida TaxID=4283 RepID=UPI0028963C52|nr:uncharacterized mitochondrial protein AtMg00810-like [Cornus florida]